MTNNDSKTSTSAIKKARGNDFVLEKIPNHKEIDYTNWKIVLWCKDKYLNWESVLKC